MFLNAPCAGLTPYGDGGRISPYHRKNNELAKLAPGSFTFSRESYARHSFPERVRLPSGNEVTKPASW